MQEQSKKETTYSTRSITHIVDYYNMLVELLNNVEHVFLQHLVNLILLHPEKLQETSSNKNLKLLMLQLVMQKSRKKHVWRKKEVKTKDFFCLNDETVEYWFSVILGIYVVPGEVSAYS